MQHCKLMMTDMMTMMIKALMKTVRIAMLTLSMIPGLVLHRVKVVHPKCPSGHEHGFADRASEKDVDYVLVVDGNEL